MIALKDLRKALLLALAFGFTAHAMTPVDSIAGAQENVAASNPEEEDEENAKISASSLQEGAFDLRSNAADEEDEEDSEDSEL